MSRIGVLGGLGPAATADFMAKVIKLTPASRDQDHIPLLVASFPHVYDRSSAILGTGPDPLPQLLRGIELLNDAGVGAIAIPCNSSHHWYDTLSAHSHAPILHIARACVSAIGMQSSARVAIFATRGALQSGFYQRELKAREFQFLVPAPDGIQVEVDSCIREIKAGRFESGQEHLSSACRAVAAMGATAVILGCTELPIAARHADIGDLVCIDSSLELARTCVSYATDRGWNRPEWES